MVSNETWNDCPACGHAWKDVIATPGLIHRTRLCTECIKNKNADNEYFKFGSIYPGQ